MRYADTSALTKLVLPERESEALQDYLGANPDLSSSAIAFTELIRTVRRVRPQLEPHARRLLLTVNLIVVEDEVLERAAGIQPITVRTLDAIHLATALSLGRQMEVLLTYDLRMAQAATQIGLPVAMPA